MLVIKNLTGLPNGYAILDDKELKREDPDHIISGLTYDQAEREFLRLKKEKEVGGNCVLQD
jgi:hypothetical protein